MNYPKWLPQTLTAWLWMVCAGALAFTLCTVAVCIGPWAGEVSPMLADLHATAASGRGIGAILHKDVAAIDMQPINASLRNVQDTTEKLKLAASHAEVVTGSVESNLPRIHKGIFYLWKHTDQTLDDAQRSMKDERKEQKEIADQTVETLKGTAKAAKDADDVVIEMKPVVSHVNGLAASLEGTGKHVEHVAEHYDTVLTAPKRWWQHLRNGAEAGAIWAARHL